VMISSGLRSLFG